MKMNAEAIKSKAEVYLMAIQSLSKPERDMVIARLLEDPAMREDILDIAIMQQRQHEPSRPFREYLAEKRD